MLSSTFVDEFQHLLSCSAKPYVMRFYPQIAFAYALEVVVEEGLAVDFGAGYNAIHEQYLMLSPEQPSLEESIISRVELYDKWSKVQRQRQIGNLLESFDPLYSFMYKIRTEGGEPGLLSPEELDKIEDEEAV